MKFLDFWPFWSIALLLSFFCSFSWKFLNYIVSLRPIKLFTVFLVNLKLSDCTEDKSMSIDKSKLIIMIKMYPKSEHVGPFPQVFSSVVTVFVKDTIIKLVCLGNSLAPISRSCWSKSSCCSQGKCISRNVPGIECNRQQSHTIV